MAAGQMGLACDWVGEDRVELTDAGWAQTDRIGFIIFRKLIFSAKQIQKKSRKCFEHENHPENPRDRLDDGEQGFFR
jgi:hypothetical protein